MGEVKLKWTRRSWARFGVNVGVTLLILAISYFLFVFEMPDFGMPPEETALLLGMLIILAVAPFLYLFGPEWTKDAFNVLVLEGQMDGDLARRETLAYLRERGEDGMSIALGDRRYRLEVTERGRWATVVVRSLPPVNATGLAGFQEGLRERIEEAIERDATPSGRAPDGEGDASGPIVGRRFSRQWALAIGLAVLMALLMAAIPLLLWTMASSWRTATFIELARPAFFVAILTLASPLILWILRIAVIDLLEERVELEGHRVRAMRGGMVLKRIAFDERVTVEAMREKGDEEGKVVGYTFSKGWITLTLSSEYGYLQEDIERMWPVVEAAVWRHRMRLKDNTKGLFKDSED